MLSVDLLFMTIQAAGGGVNVPALVAALSAVCGGFLTAVLAFAVLLAFFRTRLESPEKARLVQNDRIRCDTFQFASFTLATLSEIVRLPSVRL